MRIQHNIMAMNAYRNYNLNNKALSGNLEKLSSGYKINRAGDDAAGLAISEKMRAQITGLNAAQKNVKDGISLVKTAEGAMQEIQDMLNRMDYLATQSANGTYDNETDRAALQKEVEQLKSEINRIADSANFNGIKLLDGSLDSTVKETINATTFEDMQSSVRHTDASKGYADVQGSLLQLHKDSTGASKTSFEIDLSDYRVENATETDANGVVSGQEVTFELAMGNGNIANKDYVQPESGTDALTSVKGDATDSGKWTATITADKQGKISGADIAAKFVESLKDDDKTKSGTITLKTTMTAADGTSRDFDIEYKVTADGNKLKFEMTDKGYKDAAAAYEAMGEVFTDGDDGVRSNVFNGNFDIGITATTTKVEEKTITDDAAGNAIVAAMQLRDAAGNLVTTQAGLTAADYTDQYGNTVTVEIDGTDTTKFTLTTVAENVNWGLTDQSTSNIKKGTAAAGTQLADGFTGTMGASEILDGSGFKFGDTAYVFAGTDETLNAKYDSNVKVVDIRDLMNEDKTGLKHNSLVTDALSRLSEAAEDNEMFSIQVSHDKDSDYARINFREKESYKGDGKDGRADLTTVDGVKAQVQHFNGVKANYEVTEAKGKDLTLQIGDTSDSYNQMKVSVGDMHTTGMGIADIDIGTQDGAAAAVQTIKDAINYVSSVRGDLGAIQNRLDHTSNNLSVMAENIQDAESTIRDTDVAEEMMSYVKNNILVQSAQAMLAQANQVPQGVLQLLG